MVFKPISFRCPADLLERIDSLASAANGSRSVVLVESVRIFAEKERTRGGYILPLSTFDKYAGKTLGTK